jgi:hypothetical protein
MASQSLAKPDLRQHLSRNEISPGIAILSTRLLVPPRANIVVITEEAGTLRSIATGGHRLQVRL